MYKAVHISPMIPSFDMKETVSFFVSCLEFEVTMHEEIYSILQKNNLTVHILRAGTNVGEMEFYLEVDDIEKVWHSLKDKLTGLKFKAPFERKYGMKEIHIVIPQTNTLLFIGQNIS